VYQENCALCHGERGDGRGVRREGLSAPARDFTDPNWRNSTTPLQVYVTVTDGKPSTSMPSWKALSEQQRWDVTAYVLSLSGMRR